MIIQSTLYFFLPISSEAPHLQAGASKRENPMGLVAFT